MVDERPDQEHPDQDGLEARDASAPEGTPADGSAPASPEASPAGPPAGLRSASAIFGEAKLPENWPTRRQIREAERAAAQSGEVPSVPPTSASAPEPPAAPGAPVAPEPPAAPEPPVAPVAPEPEPPVAPEPEPPTAPEPEPPSYDAPTQAVPMQRELDEPTFPPSMIAPPSAPVPPSTTAPHPLSIELPFLSTSRDERAAEAKTIDEERRRVDPLGVGRDDVDWLGRATGSTPIVPGAPGVSGATGVHDTLPSADEPPSFTDLLRISGGPEHDETGAARPFDWAAAEDAPETAASPSPSPEPEPAPHETTSVPVGSWSLTADLGDELMAEDDVVDESLPEPDVDESHDGPHVDEPFAAQSVAAAEHPAPADAPDDVRTTALPIPDAAPEPEPQPSGPVASEPVAPEPVAPEPAPEPSAPVASDPEPEHEPDPSTTDVPDLPTADVPWWAEPEAAAPIPPTAAPPLIDPPEDGTHDYPAHLPPAVGQDLDALLGIGDHADAPAAPEPYRWSADDWKHAPEPAADSDQQDEIDQTEWPGRETSDTRAINALFGTGAMQKVDGTPETEQHPVVAGDASTRMMPVVSSPTQYGAPRQPAGGDPQHPFVEPVNRLQAEGRRGKGLLVVGAIVIIVVMLVAVFFLAKWIIGGDVQHQPASPSSTPAAAARTERSATPAPAPTAQFASSIAPAGTHSWRDLAGGECLQPYENAWSRSFSVVDCGTAHLAQMTYRGTIDSATYPGADALAGQMNGLCSASAALDMSAAAQYSDVQIQGAYPGDQAEWDSGDHYYYCFVSRSSGQPLTVSLAPSA